FGSILSEMRTLGLVMSLLPLPFRGEGRGEGVSAPGPTVGMDAGECVPLSQPSPLKGRAQNGQAALSEAQAQSSQGPSASMSAVSTVAPHQMRKPGGASR